MWYPEEVVKVRLLRFVLFYSLRVENIVEEVPTIRSQMILIESGLICEYASLMNILVLERVVLLARVVIISGCLYCGTLLYNYIPYY